MDIFSNCVVVLAISVAMIVTLLYRFVICRRGLIAFNKWLSRLPKQQQHYCLHLLDWCYEHSSPADDYTIEVKRNNELVITCYCADYQCAYECRDACRNLFHYDIVPASGTSIVVNFIGNHNNALCASVSLTTKMGDFFDVHRH